MTTTYQLEVRADTAANWATNNPILGANEPGRESDTGFMKYGDGTTHWNALPYKGGGPLSGAKLDNAGTIGQFLTKTSDGYAHTSLALPNVIVDTPEAHNAKRDGKLSSTVQVDSGALNILRDESAQFVVGDVGKTVVIWGAKNAGAADGTPLWTTISGFTDSKHVTLTAPSAKVLAAGTAWAAWASDDRAAIAAAVSNAVAECQANGTYYCEIWLSSGMYGSFSGVDSTQRGRAQIPLPYIPDTSPKVTIVFRAVEDNTALAHWQQLAPQMSGCCILSNLDLGFDGALGSASVIGGPTSQQVGVPPTIGAFSNMLFVVDGLSIVTGYGLRHVALDLQSIAESDIRTLAVNAMANFSAFTGTLNVPVSNSGAVGVRMPQAGNNDNNTIGNMSIAGYTQGLISSEHVVAERITILYNDAGVVFTSTYPHACSFLMISAEGNKYHIDASPAGPPPNTRASDDTKNWHSTIDIVTLDIEDDNISFASGGTGNVQHINDPNNILTGTIKIAASSEASAHVQPKINGAKFLTVIDSVYPGGAPITQPAVPAASTDFRNPFCRQAFIDLSGGTAVAVTVDGVPWNVAKTIPLRPNGIINLGAYTGTAPTWHWVLS